MDVLSQYGRNGAFSVCNNGRYRFSGVQAALRSVSEDVKVPEDAPGGMAAYRNTLARSFLFKALVSAALHLRNCSESEAAKAALMWAVEEESAGLQLHRPPIQGVQFYAAAEPDAIVGQSLQHRAADLQARPCTTGQGCNFSCMSAP
jgi:hypothetical protein